MSASEPATYFLLDSQQGHDVDAGWRSQHLQNVQITSEGLRLAPSPVPPIPLKDAAGTFGGLENPTGAAIAADGTIYISDLNQHQLFRLVRPADLGPQAVFFRVSGGDATGDRFVYVPVANRLERWPQSLRDAPASLGDVEIISERVWDEVQARQCVLGVIEKESLRGIDATWRGDYPCQLLPGGLCGLSIRPVPCLGGQGWAPRQFNQPRGLAISPSGLLYVADSQNHRVQVFDLRGWVLKAIWGKRAGRTEVERSDSILPNHCPPYRDRVFFGQPMSGSEPGEFKEPWDVAVDGDEIVYIADTGNGRVQKYDCCQCQFTVIEGQVLAAHGFQVLYGDQAQARFVFVPARQRLERWPSAYQAEPSSFQDVTILSEGVPSVAVARHRVLEMINAVGAKDILVEWEQDYPKALANHPQPEPPFQQPTHLVVDRVGRLYVVDQDYDYVKVLDRHGRVLGRVAYRGEVSDRFRPTAVGIDGEGTLLLADGTRIARFIWDGSGSHYDWAYTAWLGDCGGLAVDAQGRVVAVGGDLNGVAELSPLQAFATSGTYRSQPLDSRIEHCPWHKLRLDLAEAIPSNTRITVWTYTAESPKTPEEIEALTDDDWQTGQTNGTDVLVLSPPGRWLWLKIDFQGNGTTTPVLKRLKVDFPRVTYLQYLPAVYQADPVSQDFLERMLSIFETTSLSIETTIDQISRYFDPDGVSEEFLTWLAGWVDMVFDPSWSVETRRRLLRHAAELYRLRGTMAGLKRLLYLALGLEVKILEHFQLRRWLFLASQSTLGNRSQLWGNQIVNRLQLDENSRIGEFALVSTGDPVRDPFQVYAHKFSVFVPAALCRSPLQARQLEGLIAAEKPAHTQATVCRVEPRFRVGIQSTVGFDTLVGAYPRLVLNHCSTLGYDAILSSAPDAQGPPRVRVDHQSRVGVTTVVG